MNFKMIELLLPFIALFFCGILLVFYRLRKKFKKDRAENRMELLDANIVEILIFLMYVALAAPGWSGMLIKLFG